MFKPLFDNPDRKPKSASGRRATGRLLQDTLCSSAGMVLDLSVGGARILSKRRRRGEFKLWLSDGDMTVHLRAEAVWSRRLGFFQHDLGVKFLDMTPELSAQLNAICANGRIQRSVAFDVA